MAISLDQAMRLLELSKIRAAQHGVADAIDSSIATTQKQTRKIVTGLRSELLDAMAGLKYTDLGAIDPLAPENAQILALLRSRLDAAAAQMSAAQAGSLGIGMKEVASAAADIWAEAGKARAIMLSSLQTSIDRVKRVNDAGMSELFQVFQDAMLNGTATRQRMQEIVAEITDRTVGQAGQLVHDISFGSYRQASLADGNALEAERYYMGGPIDDRITEICYEHVGKSLTKAEWLRINPNVFLWGLHYG